MGSTTEYRIAVGGHTMRVRVTVGTEEFRRGEPAYVVIPLESCVVLAGASD